MLTALSACSEELRTSYVRAASSRPVWVKQSSHLLDGAVLVDGEVVVAQLRSPAAVDQNVGGFDISVDDTVLVQVLQPIRHV